MLIAREYSGLHTEYGVLQPGIATLRGTPPRAQRKYEIWKIYYVSRVMESSIGLCLACEADFSHSLRRGQAKESLQHASRILHRGTDPNMVLYVA
jgi:hypothetical protein